MAVPQLSFVPKTVATYNPADSFKLDEIPEDVKAQVEEVYKTLKEYEGNMHAEFTSKVDMLQWERMVKSYCAQRPAGPIHYRRSPIRNQPEGHVNFRITDVPEKNAKDSAEINEAVKKVTAAKKTAAVAK